MILFFRTPQQSVIAVENDHTPDQREAEELSWLFGEAKPESEENLKGYFVGPRREMITPWSTNAVEITQNMGLKGIARIEEYFPVADENADHDPMLQRMYKGLDQQVFTTNRKPEPIVHIDDLEAYNEREGLALSKEEMDYLKQVEKDCGRPLTDSEVFGFAQINSEHCRHKIFGGTFVIDGKEMESSLFQLIKDTTKAHRGKIISAYKDNVAFAEGPVIEQFAPADHSKPDYFQVKDIKSVISLKAETHNFPTTVEPFNGASTGTGGEIRDRMGGGKGSWPIAGTAVYITSYPRTDEDRAWEQVLPVRKWLYQTPEQILIKASNGASDFGNKFGQPLICGSLLTFEHKEGNEVYGYDKVIMLAGGVGYGTQRDCLKGKPEPGNKIVLLGGDNYRIGLGGGSVSSVDTGRYSNGVELNAVQRANAEMQKRTYNVVRALCEEDNNPVVSIHDHGAAGHVNCLSELVEDCGGLIDMSQLPIGDKTLSSKEIIANESQERMGLLIQEEALEHVRKIAERERAPMYVVGETTGDHRFAFQQADGVRPFDLAVSQMFGSSPKTYMIDETVERHYQNPEYDITKLDEYINNVLQLEAVACKDWLTNKVDRSVTGRIARQQCQGVLQLPLSDCGVVALDYRGKKGIATAIGHAPQVALADPAKGSIMAVSEALTNVVWAPLNSGIDGVSLSANWMWPCRSQKGEDARLYTAVKALSDYCQQLGINVPTGKDSLSMTQQYPDGTKVIAPGTVIVSAGAEVDDVRQVVSPVMVNSKNTSLYHIDFSFDQLRLGGSAFAQSLNKVGDDVPTVTDPDYFRDAFNAIQQLIRKGVILAGHDISAGGLITTLLEMCFANVEGGMELNLDKIAETDLVKILFAENPGVVIQVSNKDTQRFKDMMEDAGVGYVKLGHPCDERHILVNKDGATYQFGIDYLRDVWYSSSYLLDRKQVANGLAKDRFNNYKQQPLEYKFNKNFTGTFKQYGISPDRRKPSGLHAAVIREKGTNSEREMAYALYLAGFDVKDVTMTDLESGRETLDDINMIVFCGGFSNSDVLGSAKGWAGAFRYSEKAKETLNRFYARPDTLSLGVCNGCQLMMELNLLSPDRQDIGKMVHNNSHKFESCFVSLNIPKNNSVMFGSLSGNKIGIWVAHAEGKFSLKGKEEDYNIIAKYNYSQYPGNPNGSDFDVAGLASADGRHVAIMPHLERAFFPWQCGNYPADRKNDEVTPWMEAFVNARKWVEKHKK
ncbi:MAG: phosphoribosylformylglycinamidine synthase [Bacteroidaceae bacterium]|jgi:phosphoribosylformylglycinamidine synthase|nr:phosphoribosylformylglycinamidine synthase [Bacteroidaceae bacterium]